MNPQETQHPIITQKQKKLNYIIKTLHDKLQDIETR